jgi:hypothetical protein
MKVYDSNTGIRSETASRALVNLSTATGAEPAKWPIYLRAYCAGRLRADQL